MKSLFYTTILIVLFACVNNQGEKQVIDSNGIDTVSVKTLIADKTKNEDSEKLDIQKIKTECEALLQSLKNENYTFEIKTDTFNFKTDNAEQFTKGHGIFWQLYRDSTERLVRHYLFEPNTKKILRIYLVEADYDKAVQLERVISNLETSMNDSISAPGSEYFTKWGLSPTNDYVLSSDKKLYWLNLSNPYSNSDVLKFIDVLKNNVDTTKFKGRIICLFGSDCKNENVP